MGSLHKLPRKTTMTDNVITSPSWYEILNRRKRVGGAQARSVKAPPKFRRLNAAEMSHVVDSSASAGPTDLVQTITLKIMTWNVDGFSTAARRLAVVSYLWRHHVDIAVITETHLFDGDIFVEQEGSRERIMKIQLDHY